MKRSGGNLKGFDPVMHQLFELTPRKGDLKKAEIVRASIDSIALNGIDGTTYDSIAKSMGTTRSHVAYYFKSKDDIVRKTIEYIIANGQSYLLERFETERTSAERQLARYIELNFEWFQRFPDHVSVLIAFFHLSACNPEYRQLHWTIRNAGADRAGTLVKNFRKELGLKLKEADLIPVGRIIQDLITGAAIELFTIRGKPKGADFSAKLRWTVRAALAFARA